MKAHFYIVTFLILILLGTSCRKDKIELSPIEETEIITEEELVTIPDTIYPLSYFPAYPGSHWLYNDGSYRYTDFEWQLKNYTNNWPDPWSYYFEPNYTQVYVPVYHFTDDYSKPVYEYKFLPTGSGSYFPSRFLVNNPNEGQSWNNEGGGGMCTGNTIFAVDTTLWVNNVLMDSVVGVHSYDNCNVGFPTYEDKVFWGIYRYYRKGVGLVKETYRNYPDSTLIDIELQSYYINK